MKFTIIMPAYNAEKTIEKAVRSIMEQTYKDLQILIIDDGSTDNTFDVVKQLSKEDGRIEYYHKENGGIGSAYIMAFTKAIGDYYMFVDSDDYVSNNFVEVANNTIKDTNADIVQFGRDLIGEDGHLYHKVSFDYRVLNGKDEILKDYFYGSIKGTNFPGLSIRAIKKSLFEGFDYYSASYAIDDILVVHVNKMANKLVYIPGTYYYAIRYESSISHSPISKEKVKGQFDGLCVLMNMVKDQEGGIRYLVSVRLLIFLYSYYSYLVEALGYKSTKEIVKSIYRDYEINKLYDSNSHKYDFRFGCLRYAPLLVLAKQMIKPNLN